MAKTFIVTTANESIKLDARRHAEATFIVTNNTARTLRGFAQVRPLRNTEHQWLKLKGENERDFPAHTTQQFTVTVDVPAEVPPGKYGFRIVLVSTNPDEDFTEGPTVTTELAKPGSSAGKTVRAALIAAISRFFNLAQKGS